MSVSSEGACFSHLGQLRAIWDSCGLFGIVAGYLGQLEEPGIVDGDCNRSAESLTQTVPLEGKKDNLVKVKRYNQIHDDPPPKRSNHNFYSHSTHSRDKDCGSETHEVKTRQVSQVLKKKK